MSIIVVDEITPSCPMFLAMTKQLTVVAEPSITRIAISSLSLNPKATAIGRNTATKPTSLINVAANSGFAFADAFFKPGQNGIDRAVLKKTFKGIVTNPIILGIVAGLLWSAIGLPYAGIPAKAVTSIGNMATPMGLMAMGATFDLKKASAKAKPAFAATFINSYVLPFYTSPRLLRE